MNRAFPKYSSKRDEAVVGMRVHSLENMHVTDPGWSLKPAHRAVALLGRAVTLCPPTLISN